MERAAADVRRLQAALDVRAAATPDNEVELAMIGADLRRAKLEWRRQMEEVLAPQVVIETLYEDPVPVRNPLVLPQFEGAG